MLLSAAGRTRLVAIAVVSVAMLGAVGCEPPAPPPGPPTGICRPDPFDAQFQRDLDAFGAAAHHLTVAVFDDRTGCWYHLRRGQRVTTASVVKVEIMAATILRAQDQRRPVTDWEMSRITPMINSSDDAAASALWVNLGGAGAMSAYGDRMGLGATVETEPKWGLTSTTAEDQAEFVHELLQGGLLDPSGRALAWWQLQHIREDQRWGVPKGVPAGWEVGHKNGFANSSCCGWRVNSVGYVADPDGGGYSVAILSDGWGSLPDGIPTVEAIAARVSGRLTK
jgi:beta-lactamase class A